MSSVKPRRKIPYIGKPATASEILAAYDITPEVRAAAERAVAKVMDKRSQRRSKKSISARTARAK